MGKYTNFQKELVDLINKHSMENGSDTPDFILARYLVTSLEAFEIASNLRTSWYHDKVNKDFKL